MNDQSPGKANEWAIIVAMVAAVCAVICALGLCLMSVAYYLMSPAEPTAAAAFPQAAPPPTPTPIPPDPGPPEDWNLVFKDFFFDSQNDWPEELEVADYGTIDYHIEDGYYRWSAESHGPASWWAWMDYDGHRNHSDYYLSADARKISGSDVHTGYGLVFRFVDDYNFYMFVMSDDSTYTVELANNDEYYAIIPWTSTDAIYPNQDNRLAVLVDGANMSFFINDELVNQASDDTISTGTIGLVMTLYRGRISAEVEFDNVEVYAP
jgi:hypothetical protein